MIMSDNFRTKTNSNSPIHFGTDGWRGIIADQFTFENVRIITYALSETFRSHKSSAKIFVGYDHRFLAEQFAQEVVRILRTCRFNAHLLPFPVTSPFLSFLTWKNKSPFGIMITASHNPPEYLGFKVKGSFGGSITQETVSKIEHNLKKNLSQKLFSDKAVVIFSKSNHVDKDKTFLFDYLKYLSKHIDLSLFRRKKIAMSFDGLYGPGGKIIQHFFSSCQNKISTHLLHTERDPLFGGHQPEPIEVYMSDLKKLVQKTKSVVGFAVDGDGDRLGAVDENGKYLTPQQIFALLLHYLVKNKKIRGKVVQTVSMGYLSERIAQDHSLPFEEVPVGFKYVAEKMLKEDVIAGGEESGGYAFGRIGNDNKDQILIPERDGLFSALLFLEMILYSGKKLSELLNDLQKLYGSSSYLRHDLRLNEPIENKSEFFRKIESQLPERWLGLKIKEFRKLDGLKVIIENGSWLLLRPSGTEPLLRIYAEFPQKKLVKNSLAKLYKLVYNVLKL